MNLVPVLKIGGEWLDAAAAARRGLVLGERTKNGVRRVSLENRSGATVRPEQLGWRKDGRCDFDALLAAFTDRWAADSGARRRFAPPVGWCSWHYYFHRVTLADVVENMDWFAARRAYMDGRLWINDPDTLIVCEDHNDLTSSEVELWARVGCERRRLRVESAPFSLQPFQLFNPFNLQKRRPPWP